MYRPTAKRFYRVKQIYYTCIVTAKPRTFATRIFAQRPVFKFIADLSVIQLFSADV